MKFDRFQSDGLVVAYSQKPAGEIRAAVRRLGDGIDDVCPLLTDSVGIREELNVPPDGGEDVVKIMGDPAGETSDGFHFLRIENLSLESLLHNTADDGVAYRSEQKEVLILP